MNWARHRELGRTLAWIAAVCVTIPLVPAHAQSQRKAPPKSATSREKEDPLAPLLRQANDAIDKMDFASALDPLQKYIAQRPEDSYAHFQIGYAYAGLKRPADAKTEFSRAIALDPKMAAAHLNLGLVLMDSDPAAAAESFRHAAEFAAHRKPPSISGGFLARTRWTNWPKRPNSIVPRSRISPKDYESHFALGRVLLRTGDAPGAEGQFREAIAARGDSAPARLGLANSLLTQDKYEAANDALNEYLKLNPGDRSAHFDRAAALLES